MKKIIPLVCILSFSFYSCGLFLSPFSAQSYQYFIQLKVIHLKFIETFTESEQNEYDINLIKEYHSIIDLKFREAIEYQQQVSEDATRLNAFIILREEFDDNYNELISTSKLFGGVYAKELIEEVSKNYNLAIKGETLRRNTNE